MKKITFLIISVLMCAYSFAQPGGGIQFTPPPPHPELQTEKTGDCGCMKKQPVFSCYPECTHFKIEETTAPVSENSVVRITSDTPFSVEFTGETGKTFTYEGIVKVVFNYANSELFYDDTYKFRVGNFKSIKIIQQ